MFQNIREATPRKEEVWRRIYKKEDALSPLRGRLGRRCKFAATDTRVQRSGLDRQGLGPGVAAYWLLQGKMGGIYASVYISIRV